MDLIVSFPGGKRVDAQMGDFIVRTDQPVKEGGEGEEPSPFMYCLASLATCAGFYVLSYLQARDLPIAGIKLVQSHEVDTTTGRMKKISMEILVPPGIDVKHHQPMIRSAEKCAVKKLIEQGPEFQIVAKTIR